MNFKEKLTKSENIIIKTLRQYQNPVVGWTGGKDSTVLMHLVLSFKMKPEVVFLDSGKEFPEIMKTIKEFKGKWDLNLHTYKYKAPTLTEARENKIKALNKAIEKLKIDALFVAIRWDEDPARSEEKYISKRENPAHTRIHPLLHWTIKDIWHYIKKMSLTYCSLYDEGYTSLGIKGFTHKSKDGSERGGRDPGQDMKELRKHGYF